MAKLGKTEDPIKALTGVFEKQVSWESHELDAYVDYPERRRHPALTKADISSKPKKHNDNIRAVADSYAQAKGMRLTHEMPTLKVNSEKAGKLADAYHNMPHNPNHPQVKASYDALISETAQQYNHIVGAGLKVSKMKDGQENPYKSSADLHADLKDNNHMWYYPTESGFGTDTGAADHPMLRDTGHKDGEGKPMLANDMFRIVHDYFGHGKEGFGFGSAGEENAWAHHKQMYSPTAHGALTSETRGQNSWVNFGPNGEQNRANPANTVYAQQKAGLMPDWAHGHGEESQHKDKMHKSEEAMVAQTLFMAYDGDNAGRLVGRAILHDNPQELHEVSNRIAHGHDIVSDWVEAHGGKVISGGGDEGTFTIPPHAVEDIEKLRSDYQYATQLTMTVGVGTSLSEAGRALMVGKFRGKDQVCQYDRNVDVELKQAKDHVASGQATGEEKKLGEAYLSEGDEMNNRPKHQDAPAPMAEAEQVAAPAAPLPADDHADCQYCAELAQDSVTDEDHCTYCHGNEQAESEPHCQYCAEAEAQSHEHTGDDCQYCQEAAAQPQDTHEHSGDDCEYCAADSQVAHDPNSPDHEADCQYCADASTPNKAVSGPADMPGTEMQDNVSHPATYGDQNAPADLALDESEVPTSGPDLSQVLQGGLDAHGDSIAREKVVGMVAEALEGFKQCKPIIERSQQQAPQLYASSIAMLKAMIEMAKMLGLSPKPEQEQAAMPGEGAPQQPTEQNSNPQPPQGNPQGGDPAGKPRGR